MIIPLVAEEDWLRGLVALPAWQPRGTSILVVCPHPDDETVGAGGLIASMVSRGMEVTVVAVTDGEAAYPGHAESSDLGQVRTLEQEQALAMLGVTREKIVRLHLPDSDVVSSEDALAMAIAPLMTPTTLVLAPWPGDFHPDHEACGRAAVRAADRAGAPVGFYVFWTWHRGTLDVLDEVCFQRFALSEQAMLARERALACHRSQLHCEGSDPVLPANLLAPMRRPFEVFIDA